MDLDLLRFHLIRLGLAYLLTIPVAWNRERRARSAGLRTFPLVAIASCAFVLIARETFHADPSAQARIVQGLITGIGFIGGGAILKDKGSVHGTATAASIWCTGGLGAAVAYDHFEIALILSAVNFATFRWIGSLKPDTQDGEHEDQPA